MRSVRGRRAASSPDTCVTSAGVTFGPGAGCSAAAAPGSRSPRRPPDCRRRRFATAARAALRSAASSRLSPFLSNSLTSLRLRPPDRTPKPAPAPGQRDERHDSRPRRRLSLHRRHRPHRSRPASCVEPARLLSDPMRPAFQQPALVAIALQRHALDALDPVERVDHVAGRRFVAKRRAIADVDRQPLRAVATSISRRITWNRRASAPSSSFRIATQRRAAPSTRTADPPVRSGIAAVARAHHERGHARPPPGRSTPTGDVAGADRHADDHSEDDVRRVLVSRTTVRNLTIDSAPTRLKARATLSPITWVTMAIRIASSTSVTVNDSVDVDLAPCTAIDERDQRRQERRAATSRMRTDEDGPSAAAGEAERRRSATAADRTGAGAGRRRVGPHVPHAGRAPPCPAGTSMPAAGRRPNSSTSCLNSAGTSARYFSSRIMWPSLKARPSAARRTPARSARRRAGARRASTVSGPAADVPARATR